MRWRYKKMAIVEGIELGKIKRNELNPFLYDDEDKIKALAKSIEAIGLAHPLVVYRQGGDYIILSGHKRFEALKRLYSAEKRVACKVIEEPESQISEEEFMLECNICRNSDNDLKVLIERANYVWDNLSSYERDNLKEEYEEEFRAKYGHHYDYDKIKKQNFRPRLEYIKRKTGISNVSNRTVTNLLKKSIENDSDTSLPVAEIEEIDEYKETEKFINNVLKKVKSLANYLENNASEGDLSYQQMVKISILQESLREYLN